MNTHNMSLQYIKENHPNFSAAMDFSSKGLKNKFETARVNESRGFEPLKFYCSGPELRKERICSRWSYARKYITYILLIEYILRN